jgi:hypothetical protein
MSEAVAVYGARFGSPFWADFHIDGDTRTVLQPDGTTITETLDSASDQGYTYTASGVDGIERYRGSFAVTDDGSATRLVWTTSFEARDTDAAARMLSIIAGAGQTMLSRLASHFAPVPDGRGS